MNAKLFDKYNRWDFGVVFLLNLNEYWM